MIEINEKELTIGIKETLSFEHHVQPIFDNVIENVKSEIEDFSDEHDEDELENMKKFLIHELTNKDKLEILEKIKEDYEYEIYRNDCEVSIFDNDGIFKGIADWITDNFDFECSCLNCI